MKFFLLITLTSFFSRLTFAQTIIRAVEAPKHVGEYVSIQDTIYSGKVYQDSICVLNIGDKSDLKPFIAIVTFKNSKHKIDERNILTMIKCKAKFEGVILSTPKEYIMVINDPIKNMKFREFIKIN